MIPTTSEKYNFKQVVAAEIASTPVADIDDIAYSRPIFIGGCGSSGTTLLKTMLDSHKNIACGQEISFFDHPLLYWTELGQLHEMFLEQNFTALTEELVFPMVTNCGDTFGLFLPNFGREYHGPAATNHMFETARDTKHFLDIYFSNFAARQGKNRWAEKTPNNVFCVDEMLDFYPDGKFVHVIRDGRDVVLSLARSRKFDLNIAAMRWLLAVEAGIRHRGNPRYYELKYEDLVQDTEICLRNLMEFLDEEWDENMLNFTEAGKDNPLNYGTTPVFTRSVGKWQRSDVTMREKKIFDLGLAGLLKKVGYEV
jgi:hypothetical protein